MPLKKPTQNRKYIYEFKSNIDIIVYFQLRLFTAGDKRILSKCDKKELKLR